MTRLEARQVIADVAREHGVTVKRVVSKERTRWVSDARAAACRRLHGHVSMAEIGRLLGYTGHQPVWVAIHGDETKAKRAAMESRVGYGL